jgi:hypothetical protein
MDLENMADMFLFLEIERIKIIDNFVNSSKMANN